MVHSHHSHSVVFGAVFQQKSCPKEKLVTYLIFTSDLLPPGGKSLVNIKYRSGPRQHPCGTPKTRRYGWWSSRLCSWSSHWYIVQHSGDIKNTEFFISVCTHTDMGTNNTIFTKQSETAEMCIASCLPFIFGTFAFLGVLTAKTFPVLPNIRTLNVITHMQRKIMFLRTYADTDVCVPLLPRGERSGTSCNTQTSWDVGGDLSSHNHHWNAHGAAG